MIKTSTTFDAKHNLSHKTPMYLVHFDGEITDYCDHSNLLKVMQLSEACKLSLVDGTAFLWPGTDISAFAGVEGSSTPYQVTVGDDGGKFAKGWAGAVGGGEALGGEIVTNGTFTADTDWTINSATITIAGGELHFLNTVNNRGIKQNAVASHNGELIKTSLDVANATGLAVKHYVFSDWTPVVIGSNGTHVDYILVGSDAVELKLWHWAGAGTADMDNFSMKQVIDCPATALHIVNAKNGSTQNWTSIDAGFNYNAASYTVTFTPTHKKYLVNISGLSQKITPEEGRSSIGGLTFELLDYNDEITALLATDPYYFHRKKVTVKAGYAGMSESDMLTIFVGWVTGLSLSSNGLNYIFNITDPQKWLQRKIFRGSETAPVTIAGNPITILLRILTSTGDGTNGTYDVYAVENGLGIDESYLNVSEIEQVRDRWFPSDSVRMKFIIDKREKAKDWLEREIFKIMNIYPVIDGDGKFNIKPFKPPIPVYAAVQSFTEDNIIGLPKWDANLDALINEIEFHYDYGEGDFDTEEFYINSDSVNNRGPGKKPLTFKTKGLHSDLLRTGDVIERRKNKVWNRFAVPPIKVSVSCFYDRYLSEIGDVVPLTHSKIPDIVAGTRGLTSNRMEIISKQVDWKKGQVNYELLDTGFAKDQYSVISPTMTITGKTNSTRFSVSTSDAIKYKDFSDPVCMVCRSNMTIVSSNITIESISTTGDIRCSDIGLTPSTGWKVQFANYDHCTDEQKLYGFLSDSSNKLGTDDADANLIIP